MRNRGGTQPAIKMTFGVRLSELGILERKLSMKSKILHTGPKIGNTELEAFEKRHKLSLPEDYRAFMLEYNGGMPIPQVFDSETTSTVVEVLFSLKPGDPFDLNLACMSLDWEDAYQRGIICIGRDSCGSQIFLATKGRDLGTIYFFDREETLRPKSGAVRIAGSFDEMMNNLRPL